MLWLSIATVIVVLLEQQLISAFCNTEDKNEIIMLFYDKGEGWWFPELEMRDCQLPCKVSFDRKKINRADAVIYLLPIREKDEQFPLKPEKSVWVGVTLESRQNTAAFQYEIIKYMDWFITYERYSDIPATYCWGNVESYEELFESPIPKKKEDVLVSWFGSNCWSQQRTSLVEELMKHITIDSFGKCLHNKDLPNHSGDTRHSKDRYKLKMETIAKYKFNIAFENSANVDYVSEKIYQAYLAGSIPIYFGAPNVDELVPFSNESKSFISTSDFEDMKALADYLKQVAADERLYNSYFQWKKEKKLQKSFVDLFSNCSTTAFCRLCERLIDKRVKENRESLAKGKYFTGSDHDEEL